MPSRLRPTASVATEAILVGDPGRAMLLAQELLEQPKMSNHARGLWGYWGRTAAGEELTVQSTGMGGPSAALVLADLAKLGVTRAIRVGTCTTLSSSRLELGQLLFVTEARAWSGPAGRDGETVLPAAGLAAALSRALGDRARPGTVASLDAPHLPERAERLAGADCADMQTASVLGRGRELGLAVAAVLIVSESTTGERLDDEAGEATAKIAGRGAAEALSNPEVEG